MVSPTAKLNIANRMSTYSQNTRTFVPVEKLIASPTSSTGSASVLEWNSNSDSELFQLSSPTTLTASPSPQTSAPAMHFSLPSLVIEEEEHHPPQTRDEEFVVQWEENSFNTVQPPALSPPTMNQGDVSVTTTELDVLETPRNEDQVDKLAADFSEWFLDNVLRADERDQRTSSSYPGQDPFASSVAAQDGPAVVSDSMPQCIVFDIPSDPLTTPTVTPQLPQAESPIVSSSLFKTPMSLASSPELSNATFALPISRTSPPASPVLRAESPVDSLAPSSPALYAHKGKGAALQRRNTYRHPSQKSAAQKRMSIASPADVAASSFAAFSVSSSAASPANLCSRRSPTNSDLSYRTETPRSDTRSPGLPEQKAEGPPIIVPSLPPTASAGYAATPQITINTVPPSDTGDWGRPSTHERSPNDLLHYSRPYKSPNFTPSRPYNSWGSHEVIDVLNSNRGRRSSRSKKDTPNTHEAPSPNPYPFFPLIPPLVSPTSAWPHISTSTTAVRNSSFSRHRHVPSYDSSVSAEPGNGWPPVPVLNRPLSRSEIDSSRSPSPSHRHSNTWPAGTAWPNPFATVIDPDSPVPPGSSTWFDNIKSKSDEKKPPAAGQNAVSPEYVASPNLGERPSNSSAAGYGIPVWLRNIPQPPTVMVQPRSPLPSSLKAEVSPPFALETAELNRTAGNSINREHSYIHVAPSSWGQWDSAPRPAARSYAPPLYPPPAAVQDNSTPFSNGFLPPSPVRGPTIVRPPTGAHSSTPRAQNAYGSNVSTPWTGGRNAGSSLPPVSPYIHPPYQGALFAHPDAPTFNPYRSPYGPGRGMYCSSYSNGLNGLGCATDSGSHFSSGQYTGSTLPRDRKLQPPPPPSWHSSGAETPAPRRLRFAPTPTAPSSYKPVPLATTPLHPIPPRPYARASQAYVASANNSNGYMQPEPQSPTEPFLQYNSYLNSGAGMHTPNSNFGYQSNKNFSFVDATVIFRVEDFLYRVHRHFFERHSVHLSRLLQAYNFSPISHFHLQDVTKDEFERLLTIFYPTNLTKCDVIDVAGWSSLLSLAIKWEMPQVKALALQKLSPITSAAQKIGIAMKNGMRRHEWLLPAYTELCSRRAPLSLEEAEELDLQNVIKIWQVQHEIFNLRDVRTPSQLEVVIKEKFGLEDESTVAPEIQLPAPPPPMQEGYDLDRSFSPVPVAW